MFYGCIIKLLLQQTLLVFDSSGLCCQGRCLSQFVFHHFVLFAGAVGGKEVDIFDELVFGEYRFEIGGWSVG